MLPSTNVPFHHNERKLKLSLYPKSNPPESLSDLRPISLTPAPGKVLENILAKELTDQTNQNFDYCF